VAIESLQLAHRQLESFERTLEKFRLAGMTAIFLCLSSSLGLLVNVIGLIGTIKENTQLVAAYGFVLALGLFGQIFSLAGDRKPRSGRATSLVIQLAVTCLLLVYFLLLTRQKRARETERRARIAAIEMNERVLMARQPPMMASDDQYVLFSSLETNAPPQQWICMGREKAPPSYEQAMLQTEREQA